MMRYGNSNQGIMPTVGVGVLPLSPSYRIDRDLAVDLGDLRTDPKAPTFGQLAMAAADLPAQLPIPKPRELAPGEFFQIGDNRVVAPQGTELLKKVAIPAKKISKRSKQFKSKAEEAAMRLPRLIPFIETLQPKKPKEPKEPVEPVDPVEPVGWSISTWVAVGVGAAAVLTLGGIAIWQPAWLGL